MIPTKRTILFCLALTLASATGVAALRASSPDPLEFEELAILLETNATDNDAEIVVVAKTEKGIRRLAVHDPSLTPILDLTSSDSGRIGLAQILVESAEPDIQSVLAAYPEGRYRFSALTMTGQVVRGSADLSHDLLSAPTIIQPQDGEVLDRTAFEVIWNIDPRAEGYRLEIEGENMELNLALPAHVDRFYIPANLLDAASTYQIGLKAEGDNGNLVGVEIECHTLP